MKVKTMGGRRFAWESYNHPYGPWYRMRELGKDGVSINLKHGGKTVEAVVQPDMDRVGWYWSVRFAAYKPRMEKEDKRRDAKKKKPKVPLPERKIGGRASSLQEAQSMAEMAFMSGRPTPLEVVK